MVLELKDKKNETTPFKGLEGTLVSYTAQTGTIYGVYHERFEDNTFWMEFRPSLVFDVNDMAQAIDDRPTITTNFSGTMRPLQYGSIEELANQINEHTLKQREQKKE